MRATRWFGLLSAASSIAIAAPAMAQTPTAGASAAPSQAPNRAANISLTRGGQGVEEVVVTAQRRAERLQTTPISITALTGKALTQRNITSVTDLQQVTPSLTFSQSLTIAGTTLISIRGQSQGEAQLGYQPAVALYTDGIYSTVTSGATAAGGLYDVQRVEVLKGPQGTLFGRNATGGAVSIISNIPTDTYSGEFKAGAGDYGAYDLNGWVNLPIVKDVLALRLVAQDIQNTGYGRDLTTGTPIENTDNKSVRGTLKFDPDEQWDILVRGEYDTASTGGVAYHTVDEVPAGLANLETAAEEGFPFTPAGLAQAYKFLLNNVPSNVYDVRSALPNSPFPSFTPMSESKQYSTSATIAYHVTPDLELKSITAFRYANSSTQQDGDGTVVTVNESYPGVLQTARQITQELQFNGKALDGRLNFASGFYYYDLYGFDAINATFVPALNPANPNFFDNDVTDRSYSGYGQATYAVTSKFDVTGGVRYTAESTNDISTNRTSLGCSIPPSAQVGGKCIGQFPNYFTNVSFTVGADYKFSPDLFSYIRVARGFKAGGENEVGNGSVASFASFGPEISTSEEIGVKSEEFDRRLQLNADFYYTEYTGIQRDIIIAVPPDGTASVIENAASGTIYGLETDATIVPVDGLTLTFGGALTQASYGTYVDLTGNHSGDAFPNTPKLQGNFSISYVLPTSFGNLRANFNGSYQTKVYFQPDDRTIYSGDTAVQPAYFLSNLRVSADIDKYGLQIAGYVKNLTNKTYLASGVDTTGSLGYGVNFYAPPRTFGFDVTKRF